MGVPRVNTGGWVWEQPPLSGELSPWLSSPALFLFSLVCVHVSEGQDSWELELQAVESPDMDAGN